MNDRGLMGDDLIERMLLRRAATGDVTGLIEMTRAALTSVPQYSNGRGLVAAGVARLEVPRIGYAVAGMAAAVVVAVVIGVAGGSNQSGVNPPSGPLSTAPAVSPTTSPQATTPPSAKPLPTPEPAPLGTLEPGTYGSQVFPRRFTYAVFAGWSNEGDNRTAFVLAKAQDHGIEMLFDVYPPLLDERGCQAAPQWDRPRRTSDLLAYWSSHPGVAVASRTPVAIGGLEGWDVDVAVKPSWRSPCDGTASARAYVVRWYDGIPFTHGMGTDRQRFVILDDPTGHTILIRVDSAGDRQFEDEALAVVNSFAFDVAPTASTTQVFEPHVSILLPIGWSIVHQDPALIELRHGSDDQVDVVANAFAPTIDGRGCQTGYVMQRRAADALVAYWTSHPGLIASSPTRLTVDGADGWLVTVSRDPDWGAPCPSHSNLVNSQVVGGSNPVSFYHLWSGQGGPEGSSIGTDAQTLIVVDLSDGTTIGIAVALSDTPSLQDEAMALVESLDFEIAP